MGKEKKLKISLIINIITVIMVIFALYISFAKFKFMPGYEPVSELAPTPIFNYFTVQSNVFMGIVSLIFIIKEYQVLKGIKKEIPLSYYILKMIATIAVFLTLSVVFLYLGFAVKGGLLGLLRNSNLFFHFIIPITSIVNYILFENTKTIKFKYTLYGLLPTFLYEIFYITNVLNNAENGIVSPVHDWYYFLQNGIWTAIIVAPMMLTVTYILTLIIWQLNRKRVII